MQGQLLRCHYLVRGEGYPGVRVGFVVPSARYNAVQRNRIKRLLREASTSELSPLSNTLDRLHTQLLLIFFFKGEAVDDARMLRLHTMREEVAALCRSLQIELESKEQCHTL